MSGRPSARIFSLAALTAAILGVAGCYGQTDLATHIGQTSATLNARGTANNGPADVYFEYWQAATPQNKLRTPTKTIPGGAHGPVEQHVTGLFDRNGYEYRICGHDTSGGPTACAQTRYFFTGISTVQAYGDTFDPSDYTGYERIYVNVVAAPPNGTPSGRAFYTFFDNHSTTAYPGGISFDFGSGAQENVTCVNVQGNIAVVGLRQIPPYPDYIPFSNQQFAYIVDGGPAGAGKDRFGGTVAFKSDARDPSDCSIPANINSMPLLTHGDAAVSQVEPSPP